MSATTSQEMDLLVRAKYQEFRQNEELAEGMIPQLGRLYRDHNVICLVYDRTLVNASPINILKAHEFVRKELQIDVHVHETFRLLSVVSKLDLSPARLDLGKLAVLAKEEGLLKDCLSRTMEELTLPSAELDAFLRVHLSDLVGAGHRHVQERGRDVVLYGFGRIGRLVARLLIEKAGAGDKLNLRAVVVRCKTKQMDDLRKRVSLLSLDSVHGPFRGTIELDEEHCGFVANGVLVQMIYANRPSEVDYSKYGIHDALLIDNTGMWRDSKGLRQHLMLKGISKVLLTAPGSDIKNIVYGANEDMISPDDEIISAASCTTNAIVPILKLIDAEYGIESGHVETIHSYTNDQNLIDNYHDKERRGRSAPLNMVITETGAAKAAERALPQLKGKLTGSAVRVPTPTVSLAILCLNLNQAVDKESLNEFMRESSLYSPLQNQIGYSSSMEAVSSDFVGNRNTGIVDSLATTVFGNRVNLYVWYDNEFGYACQVVRVIQHMAEIAHPRYPKKSISASVSPSFARKERGKHARCRSEDAPQ
mmetsp:Transcript_35373/g.88926  ORF Transcript_35373/g.88926 Transcript_35373/m.88926 type:complete len:535 (+) Transcript_35373:139-1743(+)